MTTTPPYKILIMEDNKVVQRRFYDVLSNWQNTGLIYTSESIFEAKRIIENYHIDLLLADLVLPDGDGIGIIELLLHEQPDAISVVISALNSRTKVMSAFKVGAIGYILKDEEDYSIVEICEYVLDGKSIMSPSIARMMLNEMNHLSLYHNSTKVVNPLTNKEAEVLNLIGKGLTYKEVAVIEDITVGTVQVHIRNIYKKLHVNNRSEAFYEANKLGYLNE